MSRTRLLLADDHVLVRESLRMLVQAQPDFEVVAEAGTMSEALEAAREHRPDVISLDISMPGGSGVRLTEKLLRERPGSRVLVLSMHDEQPFVRSALAAGATGYVLKSSSPAVFLEGLRKVRNGQKFIDPSLDIQESPRPRKPPGARPPSAKLSDRERQVLGMLAQGLSYLEISNRLFVSIKTVETYRTRLGVKLGFSTKADLVRYAIETGVLETQPGSDPSNAH
jgi:DNA-binding NarL/FixJ family response regulator